MKMISTNLGSHSAVSSSRSSGAALSHTPEHGRFRVREPSLPHDVVHGVHGSHGPVEQAKKVVSKRMTREGKWRILKNTQVI